MKRNSFSALILAAALLLSCAAGVRAAGAVTEVVLSDVRVTVDGKTASTDPTAAVYTGADIVYYEDRETYTEGGAYGEGSDSEKHSAAWGRLGMNPVSTTVSHPQARHTRPKSCSSFCSWE